MKYKKLLLLAGAFIACSLASLDGHAQITLSPADTTVCPGTQYDIKGSFSSDFGDITTDDVFGSVVNIGFNFIFYGQTYNKCVISANNFISFDTSLASTPANPYSYSNWVYDGAKNSSQLDNVIMFPFQDVNMGLNQGTISYQTMGAAPHRIFIVEFCHCPLFSCTNELVTNQVILYEGTNIIEMHITDNPSCPGWNGGTAVEGLRHNSLQDLVPGRDAPNLPWSATNDARRFTPNGTGSYIIDSIPYNPIPIIPGAKASNITWYEEGNPYPIATDSVIHVTASQNIHYYVATITGQNGCTGTNDITFRDTSWVHFGTKYDTVNVSICEGESYNFLGRHVYQAGQYDTLFSSAMGCDSFITLNLTVNPLPDVSMKQARSLDLCSGDSVRIGIDHPENGTNYQWTKDGSDLPGETDPSIMIHGGGTYVLNATTSYGCQASTDPVTITGRDKPEAKIAPLTNEVICAYDTLQLSAQNPQSGYSYTWEPAKPFRSETGNQGDKVTGVFLQPTEISLTVYNQFGCNNSDTAFVQTKPCCEVFMPTAFTPNGDGTNDYFKPDLQPGQVLVSMKVYNRLGQLVYNGNTNKTGWDGRFNNGTPAATDTYMYLIEYTCADGKLYHKKGDINLIR
ncbi:MAG TPA: gliding motility-associated C-terminal domain-containing protein [Edaphocola sp.]|nr:gliding motility-associated C-terminal domain-containing protein [Edaphocola sp.]